ncbi:hypothetical protein TL16_g07892 [Triparma laevis f. inornata]|uniref:Uncharacterized protein n=1 Tax=Triparma laevis f. inornata TaxID=1714386 RepID=A0A9W7EI11_9STRA|nr:hypothetical protein TL16_g07892 [Triparma laevis f. inornata]
MKLTLLAILIFTIFTMLDAFDNAKHGGYDSYLRKSIQALKGHVPKAAKAAKSPKTNKSSKSSKKTSKGQTSKKTSKSKGKSPHGSADDDHMPDDDDHMGDGGHLNDDHIDVGDDDGGIGQHMCATARPQAPRDLTTGAMGSNSIAPMMALHPDLIKPPSMDVHVGHTYEFHWVHCTGGTGLSPGLGGAFELVNNPSVLVCGQPVVVINRVPNYDPSLSTFSITSPEYGGRTEGTVPLKTYIGSTTGPSYNNEVCSPYEVSRTVDLACTEITAEAMDMVCKEMIDAGLQVDTHPHKSRMLVNPMWVVPANEVVTILD